MIDFLELGKESFSQRMSRIAAENDKIVAEQKAKDAEELEAEMNEGFLVFIAKAEQCGLTRAQSLYALEVVQSSAKAFKRVQDFAPPHNPKVGGYAAISVLAEQIAPLFAAIKGDFPTIERGVAGLHRFLKIENTEEAAQLKAAQQEAAKEKATKERPKFADGLAPFYEVYKGTGSNLSFDKWIENQLQTIKLWANIQ